MRPWPAVLHEAGVPEDHCSGCTHRDYLLQHLQAHEAIAPLAQRTLRLQGAAAFFPRQA